MGPRSNFFHGHGGRHMACSRSPPGPGVRRTTPLTPPSVPKTSNISAPSQGRPSTLEQRKWEQNAKALPPKTRSFPSNVSRFAANEGLDLISHASRLPPFPRALQIPLANRLQTLVYSPVPGRTPSPPITSMWKRAPVGFGPFVSNHRSSAVELFGDVGRQDAFPRLLRRRWRLT